MLLTKFGIFSYLLKAEDEKTRVIKGNYARTRKSFQLIIKRDRRIEGIGIKSSSRDFHEMWFEDTYGFWVPVRKIKGISFKGYVHNLETETRAFLAPFVVHNCHKKRDVVRIFTRRLSEVTDSLVDIVELVKREAKAESAIFDGEVIALDPSERPLPFQELMRRFRRRREVELLKMRIPLKLFLFDILYLNGSSLIDFPYTRRWERLMACKGDLLTTPRLITSNASKAKSFMENALAEGHEGLMAKVLDSTYSPGARGKKWFKIKSAEYLDLAIVGADWGYGRRTGWLSDYYLAAYDPENNSFELLGKTFKGLTDEEFREMTERLQELKISGDQHTVWVKPEIVVEVAYSEIQRSPTYKSGFALRFARITRIRDDKGPRDADTIDRVKHLYEKQFLHKGKFTEAEFSERSRGTE